MSAVHPEIAVAICTLDRPSGLAILLDAIDRQSIGSWPDHAVSVVVVDNSPSGTVRALCAARSETGRFRLDYIHEDRRGLSFARNAALAKARETAARYLAFIDDDEMPDPGWLSALHRRLAHNGAAAAVGPVRPIFERAPPPWAVAGGFFAKTLKAREGALTDAYTCNAMIDLDVVTAQGLAFEDRFNSTGGEDTIFFRGLRRSGGTVVWAPEALVHEQIPAQRMTRAWLLKRWFRTGGTEAELGRLDGKASSARLYNGLRGLARLLGGAAHLALRILATPHRTERHMEALYTVCRGAGLIAAATGLTYAEYASPAYRLRQNDPDRSDRRTKAQPRQSTGQVSTIDASTLESQCNSPSS